jgi:hypothetical protein
MKERFDADWDRSLDQPARSAGVHPSTSREFRVSLGSEAGGVKSCYRVPKLSHRSRTLAMRC